MRTSLIAGLASCLLYPAIVFASCGSASCPLDTRSSLETDKGLIRLGYQFEYIDQNQPRISTHKASVGEIRGHHDEQRTINRIHRMVGTWGMTDRASLDLGLPYISRSHRHIHNHHGTPIPQGWDFSDIGDLAVQGRYAFYKPEARQHPTLFGILGGEFPTGKSEIENAAGDHADAGITPGSGSYDLIVGAASLQHFNVSTPLGGHALMPLFFSVTQQWNGKGHDDYRLGYQLSLNTGATYPISEVVGLMGQLNFLVKGKDSAGLTREEVSKTGGEYLYASPGLQFRWGNRWELLTLAQLPLRQRVNNIQLTSDYNLLTSLSYKFRI